MIAADVGNVGPDADRVIQVGPSRVGSIPLELLGDVLCIYVDGLIPRGRRKDLRSSRDEILRYSVDERSHEPSNARSYHAPSLNAYESVAPSRKVAKLEEALELPGSFWLLVIGYG